MNFFLEAIWNVLNQLAGIRGQEMKDTQYEKTQAHNCRAIKKTVAQMYGDRTDFHLFPILESVLMIFEGV